MSPRLLKILEYFIAYPKNHDNYGLIHGDHRKGNVLTNAGEFHFIDFDLPRYCWFMDDISRPFFSSIMHGDANWKDKLPYYIRGYRSIKRLAKEDLAAFPWFLHYKAMNMYLWTKYNWKGEIAPGEVSTKEWLLLLNNMVLDESWRLTLESVVSAIDKK